MSIRNSSWRLASVLAICRPTSFAARSASPPSTRPADLLRSSPPPVMMLSLLPEPSPPSKDTLTGWLKKSAMPLRSPLVVEPSSHISRKKAIMAVTKSA